MLCSVARAMVEPATVTGSNSATGVSTPVRATWMRISRRTVVFLLGRELERDRPARARAVKPSSSCWAKLSTFTTTPSMS